MSLRFYALTILVFEALCIWFSRAQFYRPWAIWEYSSSTVWLGLVATSIFGLVAAKPWAGRAVLGLSLFSLLMWLYPTLSNYELWAHEPPMTLILEFVPGMIWVTFWIWLSWAVRGAMLRRAVMVTQ